jgi:hypothetical protein
MPLTDRLAGFLDELSEGGFYTPTAARWRLSWSRDIKPLLTHGKKFNTAFEQLYTEAKKTGSERRNELREDCADMKAMVGWDEPVFQQGKYVGSVRRFSDRLHEIMLRAGNPAKFADRHELTGANGTAFTGGVIVLPADIPAPRE